MGLWHRMRILWLGFWSRTVGNHEGQHPDLIAEGVLQSHRQHLDTIRRALTGLIFQRKKLGDQLSRLDKEIYEIKADLQIAATEDRDELAVQLIAKLEQMQEQHRFVAAQIETLQVDLQEAQRTEKDLMTEIARAEQLTATLMSRHSALRVRRELRRELEHVGANLQRISKGSASQAIQDQIHRMEAEMETLDARRDKWEQEWQSVRKTRMANRHRDVLSRIKRNLRSDEFALPGTVAASTPQ